MWRLPTHLPTFDRNQTQICERESGPSTDGEHCRYSDHYHPLVGQRRAKEYPPGPTMHARTIKTIPAMNDPERSVITPITARMIAMTLRTSAMLI